MVADAYDDPAHAVAPFSAGSCVPGLVDGDDSSDLGNGHLSRSVDVCKSLSVDFTAIQTRYCELNLYILEKPTMYMHFH